MNKIPHYYCYDTGKTVLEHTYVYGKFEIRNRKLTKIEESERLSSWLENIRNTIDHLSDDKQGLIIYIHGFQGDNRFFVQQSGYIIQSKIFDESSHPYGMAVSLQWTSVLAYDTAVKQALTKGKAFVPVIDTIVNMLRVKYSNAPVSVLCHSMGNRVWQGLYEQWIVQQPKLRLSKVLMFAADLEDSVFTSAFSQIKDHVEKIYVFYHSGDRTLQIAKTWNTQKRLGHTGPASGHPLPDNIVLRDVSFIKDDETFAGNVTLHRYFYGSPTIRREIINILSL